MTIPSPPHEHCHRRNKLSESPGRVKLAADDPRVAVAPTRPDNGGEIRGASPGEGERPTGGDRMAGLTYEKAQNVLQAALRKADEIGVPSSAAVGDEGRELVAFARQTGALLASIEISISKAYTACSMQMDTGDLAEMTAPGQPLAGIETSHRRPLVTFAGGRPLW